MVLNRIKDFLDGSVAVLGLLGLLASGAGCAQTVGTAAGSYIGTSLATPSQDKNNSGRGGEWLELGNESLTFSDSEGDVYRCNTNCLLFNGAVYLIREAQNCEDITSSGPRPYTPSLPLVLNVNKENPYLLWSSCSGECKK